MAFKAEIKGLDSLLKKLEKFPKELQEQINEEMEDFCRRVVEKAKGRVPINIATLAQSIRYEPIQNGFAIIAGTNYAAFVEFGTRTYVKIPPEITGYASTFSGKVGGNFDMFLKNIRDWCRNKGIDEKVAYPIAVSILRKGIKPQPYFFNSYFEEKKILERNLQNLKL